MFSDIKLYPTIKSDKMKAFGSVLVAGAIRLKFKVMVGKEGLFVAWPGGYQDIKGQKKWVSEVFIEDRSLSNKLLQQVLAELDLKTGASMNQENPSVSDNQDVPW